MIDRFQMIEFCLSYKLSGITNITYAQHFIRVVSKCSQSEKDKVRTALEWEILVGL